MASKQLDLLSRRGKGGGGKGGGKGGAGGDGGGGGPSDPTDTSLVEEAQRRYLNYAVSVITSRALPDVRDGLKPVQRRILYAMYHNLHLYPDAALPKCAAIVGEVLGKYHPHGDIAAYDALVRMAQDFSLRYPLIDGHGNFGSLDGDAPAAHPLHRGQAARSWPCELIDEIDEGTVDFRPNYDGSLDEPMVLPAKLPQLLANGCAGHRGGHGHQHPAPQPGRAVRRRGRADRRPQPRGQGPAQAHQGAGLSHRRGWSSTPRRSCATSTRPATARCGSAASGRHEELKRGGQQVVITSIPYNVKQVDAGREDRRGDHRQEAAHVDRRARRDRPPRSGSCSSSRRGPTPTW